MYVRLAFAVAVHVDPEILLVDEVLAVGDEPFQRKCLDRIKQFQRDGRTIILVTHSLDRFARCATGWCCSTPARWWSTARPAEAVRHFRETNSERRHAEQAARAIC